MASSTVECPGCDGEGIQYQTNYYTESPIPVPCDECHGAGVVETNGDTMATLDDDPTNYYRDSDKPDFLVAGTPLAWTPAGFIISDTTQAERHAEFLRVQREAADAKQAASILHKKLQQEQARNNTYSEVLNAFLPLAEALGFGPQLTAEVAQKALAIVQEQQKSETFDFTKPFKGALPKSSPIADAARSYRLKPGERWLVKSNVSHDTDWTVPLKGITPWFDNLAWEYKLSVGKCGDCGRKACTPTCNASPVAPRTAQEEWVPLDMSDIQPGSTLRFTGRYETTFRSIIFWDHRLVRFYGHGTTELQTYAGLFELSEHFAINIGGERDANGQLVWKPCKKLKENS